MSYDAFISYSHAADGKLAPAVQSALQRFAKPWYALRALRIFRDTTSLSATPELWGSIERALGDSRYFILLASQEAAQSHWVGEEVRWWAKHKSSDQLLICVTDGHARWDPNTNDFDWARSTALPPALKHAFKQEPMWVDLAWAKGRDHLSRRDARFMTAITKLAAAIHGRPLDEMAGDDVRQYRRTRAVAAAAVATIAALAMVAQVQRGVAVRERDNAVALVGQMSVNIGLTLDEQGDAFGAFSWFVQALRRDGDNPQRALEHRVRVGLYARNLPRLVHSMTLPLPVTDASFSPDGNSFVTATGASYRRPESESTARVWSAVTGEPLTEPLQHGGTVYSACFSPDGTRILTAAGDGIVRIWDAHTGNLLSDAIRPGDVIRLARFSPDGRRVATAGRSVEVWDAQSGARVTGRLGAPDFMAWHIAFSPDGAKLLATYGNAYLEGAAGNARIWDAGTGAPLTPVISMGGPWVYSGGFSPDGTRFVLADGAKEAQVFATATGRPLGLPIEHGDRVSYAAFSGDGRRVVSASWDGVVRVQHDYDKRQSFAFTVGGQVREAALSPDGRMLVVGSSNGLATVWDIHTGERLSPMLRLSHADYPRGNLFEMGETPGPEFGVDFSPDGRTLVTTGWDGTVRIWDLSDAGTLSVEHTETPARALPAVVPARVQIERESGGVRVTEVASRRTVLLNTEPPPRFDQGTLKESIQHAFSRDERWLVVANAFIGSRGWLFIIDTATFAARQVDLESVLPIHRFVIGPQDDRVHVVLSNDFFLKGHTLADKDYSDVTPGHVRAWDLATGRPATPVLEDSARVTNLQFDASGQRLIGSWEGGLQLWDARSGAKLTSPIEGGGWVFSADGRYIATAGHGGARVWDARTGAPRTQWLAHRAATAGLIQKGAVALAFNDDATWLATAWADRRVRVWNIETGQPLGPEQRLDFVPSSVAFDAARQALVVTRGQELLVMGDQAVAVTGGQAQLVTRGVKDRQVLDLRPVNARGEDLALLAQALSARRFDPTEVLVMLGSQEVAEQLARVKAVLGLSAGPTLQQVLQWHASRAAYGKSLEGEDPSARFHRQQIDRIKAADGIGDAGARHGPSPHK